MRWLTALAALIVFGSVAIAAEKTPRIIECTTNSVILHPDGQPVTWAELQSPSNAVVQLLDQVEASQATQYLHVFVRPGSVKFYWTMRKLTGQRLLDVSYDVADAGEPIQSPAKPNQPQAIRHTHRPQMEKTATYFECRNNQVFWIDKEGLDQQVTRILAAEPNARRNMAEFLKEMARQDLGNQYYRLLPSYLLTAVIALEPRPNVDGTNLDQLAKVDGGFRTTLAKFDQAKYYCVFVVRDDSFPAFRRARDVAVEVGFETGWELRGFDEPIKFASSVEPLIFE